MSELAEKSVEEGKGSSVTSGDASDVPSPQTEVEKPPRDIHGFKVVQI